MTDGAGRGKGDIPVVKEGHRRQGFVITLPEEEFFVLVTFRIPNPFCLGILDVSCYTT